MEQQTIQPSYQVATMMRRLMNFIVDGIVYEIIMIFLISPIVRFLFGNSFLSNFWIGFLFFLVMEFFYYFVFEVTLQRTPGKFLTGTKVINADGSKPDIGTIAKRTLIRFVPFDTVSMYTGKVPENKGTWWHDRWATTRVVRN